MAGLREWAIYPLDYEPDKVTWRRSRLSDLPARQGPPDLRLGDRRADGLRANPDLAAVRATRKEHQATHQLDAGAVSTVARSIGD